MECREIRDERFMGTRYGGFCGDGQSYRLRIGRMAHTKWLAKVGKLASKMVGHHTIPKAVLKKLKEVNPTAASKVYGRSRGRNKILWDIPEDIHKTLHAGVGKGYGKRGGAWNTRWAWEIIDLRKDNVTML